jgi:ATP-dependent DNA helicase RecG
MKENQKIEWKSSWKDEYLKWVCGFANAVGGKLIIGQDDDGHITGIEDIKKLMVDIPNKIRDIMGIMVRVNHLKKIGKDYLEIVVEPHPYPVSYKGQYFLRSGSTNQELKGAVLDQFLLRKQGRHWDGTPVLTAKVNSLSQGLIKSFRARARESGRMERATLKESASGLLDKLHLLEGKHLKKASILLFHPDPEKFITGAFVKIGFFRTDDDLLYHDEIHGDLFSQVDKTLELLTTKYLKAGISYRGVQRVETFPVPEAALREAILNAVIHKDYASSIPIQISVYNDKLMIWNPGTLPTEWTVGKLKVKHASQPFNPDVANAFFRAGLIEAWGRGIERMVTACKASGVPEPEFQKESTGLWLVFRFPKTPVETTAKTPVETTVKTPALILEYLKKEPTATLAEISLGINKSLRAVERAASKLVAEKKLRFIGPRKGGHWEVLKQK